MTWEGLKIDEGKWKETMVCPRASSGPWLMEQLAAYPIMFPIYLAEFEHTSKDEGRRSYTVVMDAHDPSVGPRLLEDGHELTDRLASAA